MKQAKISVGISASGKSTDARAWVAESPNTRVEINRDSIRQMLVEKDNRVWSWDKWNWKREGEVTKIVDSMIQEAAQTGKEIYISDTNLKAKYRNKIIKQLESFDYFVTIVEFPIALEVAWKRDNVRANGVGHSVIASQYEDWLVHIGRKQYVADVTKPKCILVDIDGTMAHMNGKRGAFEWDKVGLDDVDIAVRMLIDAINVRGGVEVIALSGRDGVCYDKTWHWMRKNGAGASKLIMRTPNDMRKDTIVKEEIFWRDIADNYNVQFVIDDRPSVCRMWREIGLKVFQVGNPHIEF